VEPTNLALIVAIAVSAIILALALSVVWQIWRGMIDLAYLVSEPIAKGGDGQPKASLSRFQFLIFTFVIAGLYLVLSIEAGTLIEVPNGALVLLGISGGSYIVSKYSGVGEKPPAENGVKKDKK
jgi:hypothetical protein